MFRRRSEPLLALALLAAACNGSTPSAPVTPSPTPTPAPIATPAPEPTPAPAPSPTPAPCDDCEEPTANDAPPVRLTLRLYTVEDGFGSFIQNPSTSDSIPIGWYARLDVVGKDADGRETNGSKPIQWFFSNEELVKVSGNHTHQRRLHVLSPGTVDCRVRQQGVESNTVTLLLGL